MKILELHSLTYSYDKNKLILKSINAQMETERCMPFLVHQVAVRQHFFLCWRSGQPCKWKCLI